MGQGGLRTLARIAFPILRNAVGAAGNIVSNTAQDLIENRKGFTESLKDNAIGEAKRCLGNASGQKRKLPSINSLNKRSKLINRKHTIFK